MKRQALAAFLLLLVHGLAGAEGRRLVKHVNPRTLARPNGYSHLVEVAGGRTLYVSGQVAVDQAGSVVGAGDLKTQTRQVFENLKSALGAAGATLDDVVKITVFMTDVSQLVVFREVRDRYFTKEPPASSLVEVARLVRPELMIEIEAVAVVEADK